MRSSSHRPLLWPLALIVGLHASISSSPSTYLASAQQTTFDALDEAILLDILESYSDPVLSSCPSSPPGGTTSFSFDWPGTNPASGWHAPFVPFEESMFAATMSHTDTTGSKRSWTIRIGTGGNMYSHFTPDMYGEAMPPQHHAESPWVDDIQQTVSVNGDLNQINNQYNYPKYCTGGAGTCASNYIHQAGTYMRDAPYTDKPFFSPNFAKHCVGNSCLFASWGSHAHVATPFISPIMYINRYTNCGNGIIEHTQMIHNFANPSASNPIDVDYNYFNVGWGGVRSSSLPVALEPTWGSNPNTLEYTNPNAVDFTYICRWGEDGPDASPPTWRGQRAELKDMGGYTTFVTPGLLVNQTNTGVDPTLPWCRKNSDPSCSNEKTCMEPCTDAQIASGTHIRMQLKVLAGSGPNCRFHSNYGDLVTLKCDMRDTYFGQTQALVMGAYSCSPWRDIGFFKEGTDEGIRVAFVRHWSWSKNNRLMFFTVYETDTNTAINLVNSVFSNTGSTTDMIIEVRPFDAQKVVPAGYNPGALNTFTYVYGKGQEYAGTNALAGRVRRRLGSTELGTYTRDYTVFTVNWYGSAVLQAGMTYANRNFYFVGNLSSVEPTANSLVPKTFADVIGPERWNSRAVNVYASGSTFIIKSASSAQGTSTTCDSTSAVQVCSGHSTPGPGRVPYFYVSCGTTNSTATYFGADPYHFAPSFANTFPNNGDWNNGNVVRSYVCAGQEITVRPSWKLMGFFDPYDPGCMSLESFVYAEDVCDAPPPTPTQSPVVQIAMVPAAPGTDHPFVTLSCNAGLTVASCGTVTLQSILAALPAGEEAVIPCGACAIASVSDGSTLSFSGGINVEGMLYFPPSANVVIEAKHLFVQGVLKIDPPATTGNAVKFRLDGPDQDEYFHPHPENALACDAATGCNVGKRAVAVAGGQLDVVGIVNSDTCPSWTSIRSAYYPPDDTTLTLARLDVGTVIQFLNGDWMPYSVNFGPAGSSAKSMRIKYSQNNAGTPGKLEVRLGSSTGRLLGSFNPVSTLDWNTFVEDTFPIDDGGAEPIVTGPQILYLVGVNDNTDPVLKLAWFELSAGAVEMRLDVGPVAAGCWDQSRRSTTEVEIVIVSDPTQSALTNVHVGDVDGASGMVTLPRVKPDQLGQWPLATLETNPTMAAEIASLVRPVVFESVRDGPSSGSHQNLHGGHMIVLNTPGVQQKLEGVEFRNFGQQGIVGGFPIYFHNCGNLEGSLVRNNVVANSLQQCVVADGTNALQVENNVAFDTFGHCFPSGDGTEMGMTFQGNRGIYEKAQLIQVPSVTVTPGPTAVPTKMPTDAPVSTQSYFVRILAADFSTQWGVTPSGTGIGYFDDQDYMIYNGINFGPPGTINLIRIRYAKNCCSGELEVRLGGGTSGQLLGSITMRNTWGWGTYIEETFPIVGTSGVQQISLVGKGSSNLMNLAWFELGYNEAYSNPSLFKKIEAESLASQFDVTVGSIVSNFDKEDYMTYNNVDFGPSGTTNTIRLRYARGGTKGDLNGGSVEARLGGKDGQLIGTFQVKNTGGWGNWLIDVFTIQGAAGVQQLTLVGKGINGLMNLDWFELGP